MGWWRCEYGMIGDLPADIMDDAIRRVEDAYIGLAGRLPTQGELANLIEFCTSGALAPICGNPASTFSKTDQDMPKAQKAGRQGALGDFSKPPPGLMANVEPTTGEYMSDKDKVLEQQEEEVRYRSAPES